MGYYAGYFRSSIRITTTFPKSEKCIKLRQLPSFKCAVPKHTCDVQRQVIYHFKFLKKMAFLFWLLWSVDLLITTIIILAKNFKESFHASHSVPWMLILLVGCTVGGFILRVFLKKTVWGLVVAAVPLLVLLVLYLMDKAKDADHIGMV